MSDIMAISRHRMGTDGEGITTLVGFYGCLLDCKYCVNHNCHNSERIRADYTAEELIKVLAVDEPYYLMTGGGVTFGGGEPLLQAEFIHEVCQKMSKKWHRTIETSLYATWEQVKLLAKDIDYWFVDIKEINDEIYKSYTGKSNKNVFTNLHKLVNLVGVDKICVRLPLIPQYNTKEDRDKSVNYIRKKIAPNLTLDIFDYIRC
ncbi:MAG: radical SAM protein [Lachnospiraceae bacterium]|nr:radical SAM protein [Lachnospiraceae bacterium]